MVERAGGVTVEGNDKTELSENSLHFLNFFVSAYNTFCHFCRCFIDDDTNGRNRDLLIVQTISEKMDYWIHRHASHHERKSIRKSSHRKTVYLFIIPLCSHSSVTARQNFCTNRIVKINSNNRTQQKTISTSDAFSGSLCWQFNWLLSIISRMLNAQAQAPESTSDFHIVRLAIRDDKNCYRRNSRMRARRIIYFLISPKRSWWWRHSNEIKCRQMAFM